MNTTTGILVQDQLKLPLDRFMLSTIISAYIIDIPTNDPLPVFSLSFFFHHCFTTLRNSSNSNALEPLESFGTTVFMKEPIVCKLCDREKEKPANGTLSEFQEGFHTFSN